MKHFLQIFLSDGSIVKEYALCRIGKNIHLLNEFYNQLNTYIGFINNELDDFRTSDQQLFHLGRELLIPLMQLANSLPMDVSQQPPSTPNINERITRASTNTYALLKQLEQTQWRR